MDKPKRLINSVQYMVCGDVCSRQLSRSRALSKAGFSSNGHFSAFTVLYDIYEVKKVRAAVTV